MTIVPRDPETALRARHGACTHCGLAAHRRYVVIGRGVIPADLLMIGIGPGASEDLRATAFFGRAGRMLRKAEARAAERAGHLPTIYRTNVVGCRPWDGGDSENRDPTKDEATACRQRLWETITAVRAQRVILFGQYVQGELRRICPDGVKLQHPAYLAREGVDSPAFRRFVAGLADVFAGLGKEA